MISGKRKRKLDWGDEEDDKKEIENADHLTKTQSVSTIAGPPTAPSQPEPSRQDLLKQRQQQKLDQLREELADGKCIDYEKKLKTYRHLSQLIGQTRQEKLQLLTSKQNSGQYNAKRWEQSQLDRAAIVSLDDKLNLPGSENYSLVFDETQYVAFSNEETYGGDDVSDIESVGEELQEIRKSLPVYKYRQTFLDLVEANSVIVVVGETGSGKTTQLPQYLYEAGTPKLIACTQPRRVAAMSVATRVAEEMDTVVGKKVGYTVRFDNNTSEDTAVKFMTDGMLLREVLSDPTLSKYGAIMIDEAHERTLSTEILLSLLKDIISERKDLKLIVASATINAEKFSAYFGGAPILNIPGRRFPVEVHYTQAPEANYIQAALTTIFQIHLTQPLPGDILVFLTGQDEIEQMEAALSEAIEKLRDNDDVPDLHVCSIYANLPPERQSEIFEPVPPNSRKVILATNIAETSITINGVNYVIDPGYVKQNVYNATSGMDQLVVTPCSRASADQRAGRAGRVGPGKCFRLYTKWAYDHELEANPPPEILRVNLVGVVLLLLSLGVTDLVHFDFMDKPSVAAIQRSLELLYALGALNRHGKLTTTGVKMAAFPLSPNFCKCLLTADKFGCFPQVVSIVAMLGESGSLFYRPKEHKEAADKAHQRFHHIRGDHHTLLTIWEEWVDSGYSKSWCQDHFVQYKTLKRAKDVRGQLVRLCEKIGIKDTQGEGDDDSMVAWVEKSIISGFFPNVVRLGAMGDSYKQLRSPGGKPSVPVSVHPSSSVYGIKPPPKWLLYYELVLTSKEFIRNCMVISDPKLIEMYGGHYYQKDQLR